MATKFDNLSKAMIEVGYSGEDGLPIYKSIPVALKVAKELHAAGAKRSVRKSVRGGAYDTLVVKLYTSNGA